MPCFSTELYNVEILTNFIRMSYKIEFIDQNIKEHTIHNIVIKVKDRQSPLCILLLVFNLYPVKEVP